VHTWVEISPSRHAPHAALILAILGIFLPPEDDVLSDTPCTVLVTGIIAYYHFKAVLDHRSFYVNLTYYEKSSKVI
jgi:hypothetical protein